MSVSYEVERHYAMPAVLRIAVAVGKYFLLPIGVLILAGAIYSLFNTKAWLARSVEAVDCSAAASEAVAGYTADRLLLPDGGGGR